MKRIAIIGLGQIGGSIVLSLRKNKAPYHITGIEVSAKRLTLMKRYLDSINRVENPDLIVLCLHYQETVDFLNQAPANVLITDVCSGKSKLMGIANRRKLRFIGGHPMAGNEFEGEDGWRNDLFMNAPYFLTAGKYASQKDLRAIKTFVGYLDATPHLIDAQLHDRMVAITSQFPAFLSKILQQQNVPKEFQGPGFRSMTRLAKTSPALLNTFLDANASNIVRTAEQFRKELEQLIVKIKQYQ
jgi:prephenate dehydrogenase